MSDLGPAFDNAMEYMERDAVKRTRVYMNGWRDGWSDGWMQRDVSLQCMPPDEPKMMTNSGEQAAETRMK